MTAYYNELDAYAAQWLRNLIAAGHIAPGEVDERSILKVRPDDLRGFDQCHFFAGIGTWSYALRLAGWSDDRPVWTGSCPCQPFSAAGKGAEFADERHLWPAWFELIRECRPVAVFGEQVASRDALAWLDHVCADLEGEDYAVGAVDTCAAGYGAPHIRQRLYWVADAQGGGDYGPIRDHERETVRETVGRGTTVRVADAASEGTDRGQRIEGGARDACRPESSSGGTIGIMGNASSTRLAQQRCNGRISLGQVDADARESVERAGAPVNGFWRNAEWLPCRDGKARPVEPGTSPLAHGIANRVGRLRAYGNCIVAPQAAAFVSAYLEKSCRESLASDCFDSGPLYRGSLPDSDEE